MRFIKLIIILPLCLFLGSCPDDPWIIINIGYYEYHLEEWNKQNILDYQLSLYYEHYSSHSHTKEEADVNVKNGIPVSSNPPAWLVNGMKSTIPEFFSLIKEEEKNFREIGPDFFEVLYNVEYHYPRIISYNFNNTSWEWEISLTPLLKN